MYLHCVVLVDFNEKMLYTDMQHISKKTMFLIRILTENIIIYFFYINISLKEESVKCQIV